MPIDSPAQRPQYPETRQGTTVDSLHGTTVTDPYRWLEDLNSPETGRWISEQNRFAESWLSGLPVRNAFRARLTELWNYPRITLPTRLKNGVMFYQRNSGLQKQFEVVARSAPETPPRVIIDPNALSPDGSLALAQYAPAPDGRHVAYGLAAGGADWEDVKVRRVRDGSDLPEVLRWVRFSALAWTADGKGFFYSRFPARDEATRLSAPLERHALYYHRLGTPQSDDVLVYERPDLPRWFIYGSTSDDGRYLYVYLSEGADARNRLLVADLGTPGTPNIKAPLQELVGTDDGEFTVVGNIGNTLYLRTDLQAPRRKVVAVNLARPARTQWKTVIPEGPHAIESVAMTASSLVVNRLVDVASELSIHALTGALTARVSLPALGTVGGISASIHQAGFSYLFTSPLYPSTVFRYDARTRRSVALDPPRLPVSVEGYETRRVFARSKDGTRVPLFITARRGLALDGTHPTLLYGYGGFAVPIPPTFSVAALGWLDRGGVWVTAALRGGSEYGEAWHRDGMRERKQNVFDDFLAAAEYLIAERWTSARHLVINGGSNGGLLVGAAMTQRPELFAAALPQVGVLDMLRYHKFTGGAAWATEYGSADAADAFAWLRAYSPLHRVREGVCYPATMITTADHDDRVVPSHSYKFAAALQRAQGCERPVLLRVETQGSHGYRPTDRLIAEYADLWAFAWTAAGGS